MDKAEKYAIVIEKICTKSELGKKMLQKLMYLMERKGVELELGYTIHFFGPYSAVLDNTMHLLESKDIIKIDTSGRTHKISMGENKISDFELNTEENKIVQYVLDNFLDKSALELEALTTLDYVANSLLMNKGTDELIIEEVKKIKGTKFTKDYLNKELEILKEYGYIV